MARIRTIRPEFWATEQINECSRDARLLFIGLWNFCDDAGRMPLKPRQIKEQIFPGDDFSSTTIHGMIQELSENGLLTLYTVDDQDFLAVTGWHHQKINRPQKPRFPAPSEGNSLNTQPSTHEPSVDAAALAEAEPDRAHVVGNLGLQSPPWYQAVTSACENHDLATAHRIFDVSQTNLDEANNLGQEYLDR